jgi:2-succinyl-6-hydroxy-2,4-cyclohexadiene-1-carboxylate synthase
MVIGDNTVRRDIDAGDGMTLHVAASGSGPSVVLLHGFTGSSETWTPLRQKLETAHRVIAIDQPGHGRSSSPPDSRRYRLDRFASDLAFVFDSMKIERAVVIGYSMGGRAALRFTVEQPDLVAGIVLESTSPGIADPHERSDRRASDAALAADIEHDGIKAFVERWEALPIWNSQRSLPDEARRLLHLQRAANNPVGLANSLRGAGAAEDELMLDAATNIRVPALLIAGALDPKYVELGRLLEKSIARSRLEIVRNAGHAVHLEQPDEFASAITTFLSTIPAVSGRWT